MREDKEATLLEDLVKWTAQATLLFGADPESYMENEGERFLKDVTRGEGTTVDSAREKFFLGFAVAQFGQRVARIALHYVPQSNLLAQAAPQLSRIAGQEAVGMRKQTWDELLETGLNLHSSLQRLESFGGAGASQDTPRSSSRSLISKLLRPERKKISTSTRQQLDALRGQLLELCDRIEEVAHRKGRGNR